MNLIYLTHRLIGRAWVRRAVQTGLAFLIQEPSQTRFTRLKG